MSESGKVDFSSSLFIAKRKSGSKEITDYVDANHDAENKTGL